jgi:hypothetical protein
VPVAALRLIALILMLVLGGMQRSVAGRLSGNPFTTVHSSLAR